MGVTSCTGCRLSTLVGLHPYRITDHSILDSKVTHYAAYPTSGTLCSASCLNLSPNSSNLLHQPALLASLRTLKRIVSTGKRPAWQGVVPQKFLDQVDMSEYHSTTAISL